MTAKRYREIPILMYHEISEEDGQCGFIRHTNPAYTLPVSKFREQVRFLAENGYKTLLLSDVLNAGEPFAKKVVLTFDDGWADNYTQVLPVLKAHGMTATVFVVSGFVGTAGYMNWRELGEMSREGIDVQSHTVTHRPLGELDDVEIRYELEISRETLEDRLGKKIEFISMPQGVFNKKVLRMVQQAGYKGVCVSDPGFAHSSTILPVFKRINIDMAYDLAIFSRIVRMDQPTMIRLALLKQAKNIFKKVVGYGNYRRLYTLRYQIRGQR